MRQLKIIKQVTNRETPSLDKYLHEIGKVDLINAEEEVELARRIRKGDAPAMEKLIKAAQRFDETRGFKFISYAVWWIRQSILQALAEQARIVRLPLNKIGSINKINKTFAELEQKFEREPTIQEIAQALELAPEDVREAIRSSGRHVSMDAPLQDGEDGNMYDFVLNAETPSPDRGLLNDSLRKEIERALSTLTYREASIIRLYFGLNGKHPHTLEEIGEEFNLTRERVRQIKEKAIKRLKHTTRSKILKSYLG